MSQFKKKTLLFIPTKKVGEKCFYLGRDSLLVEMDTKIVSGVLLVPIILISQEEQCLNLCPPANATWGIRAECTQRVRRGGIVNGLKKMNVAQSKVVAVHFPIFQAAL